MKKILFKRDNNKKIRIVHLQLNEINSEYTITGQTGLFGGKLVDRPTITISKGKVKRTVLEQATLQFNSLISSYLDKGYKTSDELNIFDTSDVNDVESKVPIKNTDTKGMLKPMLAKSYKEVSKMDWNKDWYISTKLDGVRAMIFKKDGVIQTSSRGGKDYNIPATHILNDPSIIKIFEEHPDIVLDGELYIHGKPLSYISGLCRLEELDEKHVALQFHCYDIVNESLIFSERLSIINTFVPSEKLVIVPHIKTSTESTIMEYHNNFVANGYEGAVIRDPKKEYKCGARDARMVKLKMFTDDEFEIIGLVDGLRDEDMCFLMKTKEGNEFKAKPMGDRALKQWYRANIDSIIGKMGTVKYFGFTNTDKPVPNLPVFKSIRDNKDINE